MPHKDWIHPNCSPFDVTKLLSPTQSTCVSYTEVIDVRGLWFIQIWFSAGMRKCKLLVWWKEIKTKLSQSCFVSFPQYTLLSQHLSGFYVLKYRGQPQEWCLRRNHGHRILVTVCNFKGTNYVDLRHYRVGEKKKKKKIITPAWRTLYFLALTFRKQRFNISLLKS